MNTYFMNLVLIVGVLSVNKSYSSELGVNPDVDYCYEEQRPSFLQFWKESKKINCSNELMLSIESRDEKNFKSIVYNLKFDFKSTIQSFLETKYKEKNIEKFVDTLIFINTHLRELDGEKNWPLTLISNSAINTNEFFNEILNLSNKNRNYVEDVLNNGATFQVLMNSDLPTNSRFYKQMLVASYIKEENIYKLKQFMDNFYIFNMLWLVSNKESPMAKMSLIGKKGKEVYARHFSTPFGGLLAQTENKQITEFLLNLGETYNSPGDLADSFKETLLANALLYSSDNYLDYLVRKMFIEQETSTEFLKNLAFMHAYSDNIPNLTKRMSVALQKIPLLDKEASCALLSSIFSVYSAQTNDSDLIRTLISDKNISPYCEYTDHTSFLKTATPMSQFVKRISRSSRSAEKISELLSIPRSQVILDYLRSLIINGADINQKVEGKTLLHLADNMEFYHYYPKEAFNLFQDNERYSSFPPAAVGSDELSSLNAGMTKLLVNELGSDPNSIDSDGNTALMNAIRRGHREKVKALLKVTNLSIRNNNGNTAFDLAKTYDKLYIGKTIKHKNTPNWSWQEHQSMVKLIEAF